jgi:hypothetical protein
MSPTFRRASLPPIEQFKRAVDRGDAKALGAVLAQHAEVRTDINDPIFGFDSPALVAISAGNNRAGRRAARGSVPIPIDGAAGGPAGFIRCTARTAASPSVCSPRAQSPTPAPRPISTDPTCWPRCSPTIL